MELRSKIANELKASWGKSNANICFGSNWRAIQHELGEGSPEKEEVEDLRSG